MPFKPADNPKCPKCGKSVYAAEEKIAGGYKWHKTCFKCSMCNKALDSTNCAEHEAELFCKNCHARKYGPKGYGFGGGAGCLSMDTGAHLTQGEAPSYSNRPLEPRNLTKAPEGQGCPRCGVFVYAAEQMLARGRGWHRSCFKCNTCTKALDSVSHCDGPDKEVYCKVCYGKKFGPRGYGYGQGAGALQCDQEIVNGEVYLPNKPHLITDTSVIKAAEGEGCPRCGGVVYAAEQKLSRGREWHKKCFNCHDCHKPLDSVLACDGADKDIYCKTCYARKWGPKGYGFACGSGFLQTDVGPDDNALTMLVRPRLIIDTTSIKAPPGQGCPRCGGMVYAAEQQLAKGTMWHKSCFSCGNCRRPLDSVLACDGPDREIYCKACYGKKFGPKGFGFGSTPTLKTLDPEDLHAPLTDCRPGAGQKAPEGQGCPRCGFSVFAAEQMNSRGRMWHRRCFNCNECHRSLDSTNLNDAPDREIYCKGCYGRKFAPHGVGFGMGAGALSMG